MKNQTIKKQFLALGLGLLAASVANANLINNGSFETHDAFNNGSWGYFNGTAGNAVSGWTSESGVPIEIGTAGTYGVTGQDGSDVMELDSTANVKVDQNVVANGTYTLSFLYAARAGVDQTSDTFEVTLGTYTFAFSPTSTAMTLFTTTVTGLTGGNILSFVGTGTSDSYGALIDNVQLNETLPPTASVPEPSTWVAGMLLVLPFGIHGLRALRMRQQRA